MTTPPADGISAPLNPFPTAWYENPNWMHGVGISNALTVIFFLVFAGWALYTLILAYHLFRYGHQSWFTVPMFVVHLAVSGAIILYAMSALQ